MDIINIFHDKHNFMFMRPKKMGFGPKTYKSTHKLLHDKPHLRFIESIIMRFWAQKPTKYGGFGHL